MTAHHHHHDNHDDHDDFGGLQRDLLATGATMDRRNVLRLAAQFGAGLGFLQLMGCGDGTTAVDAGTNTNTSACPTKVPEETQGPYPPIHPTASMC